MNSPIIFLQNLFADISLQTTPRIYYTAGTYEDLTADSQDSKLADVNTKAWGFPRVVWEMPIDEKIPKNKSSFSRTDMPISLLFAVKDDEIPNYTLLNSVERLAFIRDCAMQFLDLLNKAQYAFNNIPNKQFELGDARLNTQRSNKALKNNQLYYLSFLELSINLPTECYSAQYDPNANISAQLQPQNPPTLTRKEMPKDKDLVNLNT